MTPMAIYPFRTSTYARNIYLLGVATFAGISQDYVEPVKEYAALHYTLAQIDNALAQGWITQQEYNDTIAYIQ
jgi:hypothetical protein